MMRNHGSTFMLYQNAEQHFDKKYVWWIKDKLDVKKMKDAAELFKGMHDFKSFSDKTPEDKSTKCLVENIEVTDDE